MKRFFFILFLFLICNPAFAQVGTPTFVISISDDDTTVYQPTNVAFASGATVDQEGTDAVIRVTGGSGAPTTADYLVGTVDAGLSAEIVVGTTPGGELGNTWASPTLDDSLTVASWTLTSMTGSVADDVNFTLGTNDDWTLNYDESVDNQLLVSTVNTSAIATTDPMFEILADFGTANGTGMTANQEIFGVAKGTQASNVSLFTVDEDGDGLLAGTLGVTGGLTLDANTEANIEAGVDLAGEITAVDLDTTVIADSITVTGWVLGTSSATSFTSPTLLTDLIDGVGAVDMDYGSVDVTDHTFVTDGTGDAEIVLPLASISLTETLLTAGRSLTIATNDVLADAELYTDTKCMTIETPADADNFLMYRVPVNSTVTSLNCIVEAATSAVILFQECDTAGDNCSNIDGATTITCDVDGQADDGALSNAAIDATDWIRLDIGTVTGTVGHVTACATFTKDD